ncbi:MerC domain-containing protein [Sphingobium limneticum]|uniref:MerC domain-containing protein n=1 Tax=Sphingobium limneticum TaxID=1007511 RepID=A0A5J5I7K1_9SPHN|nr:MerC domain-containing protein [Sphingobium limneticum]KAA9020804.1 MerC domain-containing protein [Sphingobium limneticum]KAA9033131.1 MerC domain-containing protein [Sphingobium limneticum]
MASFPDQQPAAHCPSAQDGGVSRGPTAWLDGLALCASSLCTLHCLGLPLLFALLPAFASRIDPGESFHLVMLALAVPTSLFALVQGRRRHGGWAPLPIGIAGLTLMGVGALIAEDALAETLWTVAGSLMLAGAHILNWRRGLAR